MILENKDKDDHEIDAISGSTITGDGVTNMIKEVKQLFTVLGKIKCCSIIIDEKRK